MRKDRITRGGGVAILINKKIPFEILPEVEGAEALFCKLLFGTNTVTVGCVYHSPSADQPALVSLYEYMQQYVQKSRLILLGDFNLPDIDWQSMSYRSPCSETLFDIMFSFDLFQVINEPTRVQGSASNILDLIFLSNHFAIDQTNLAVLDGISDHKLTLCTTPIQATAARTISKTTYPDFTNADDSSILNYLISEYESFEELANYQGTNIDTLWGSFKAIVSHCIKNFVPLKTKRTNTRNPWITRDIIHGKRKVKRLRKSLKSKNDSQVKHKLANAIREMKAKIMAAKTNYFSVTLPNFLKHSPGKFWKYLSPKTQEDTFNWQGQNQNFANSLNTYFQSVFTVDDGCTPESIQRIQTPLDMPTITETGVLNLLLSIDTKKANGPDNIPNTFLQRYAEVNAKYLHLLFNKSLSTCSLANEWKIAKVIPIHKTGSKDDVSNYRPISLTCTVGKLLEHIILKHITSYVKQENILSPVQHGFRRGLSTITQLLELTHDLFQSIDNQKQVDLIALDFSKAFDRVSHKKLISKLRSTLGNGPIINWIEDYLTNRSQYVVVNNEISSTALVTSGVPQGCVLAPLLFLIFINDLPSNIQVKIKLFADDCILYNEINTVNDHDDLNSALHEVVIWCHKWQMELNIKKTAFLCVTRKKQRSEYVYSINNIPLTRVHEHKYLGLIISHDLRWESHINSIVSSALKRLFFLRRRLREAPPETKLLAYNTFIRSVLEYGNTIWFPYTQQLINKLEGVQRKAIRFIFNKYRTSDSPSQLLNQACILTLQKRARLARLKLLFQLVHNSLNIDTSLYISVDESRPSRHKHPLTLREYAFRTDCFRYSFFPLAIKDWNSLNPSITTNTSLQKFVTLVEEQLRDN